jgi:hypothetical protein
MKLPETKSELIKLIANNSLSSVDFDAGIYRFKNGFLLELKNGSTVQEVVQKPAKKTSDRWNGLEVKRVEKELKQSRFWGMTRPVIARLLNTSLSSLERAIENLRSDGLLKHEKGKSYFLVRKYSHDAWGK